MSILTKLKAKKSLVAQVKDAQRENKQDTRMVPYYDLKDGEKMRVLILPDVNGELWCKFAKHGPNLTYTKDGKRQAVRGAGSIGTLPNNSESPIMQHGYDLLAQAESTGDKYYKEEAKKWFAKNYTYVSCLVLESPIEVKPNPDGGEVKLLALPYSIEKMIINEISEGNLAEDDFFRTPLIIKKGKNDGGFASYEDSFFARKTLTDEELGHIEEDFKIELYDYSNLDIVPATPTVAEQQEWLDKALAIYAKHQAGTFKESDADDEKPEPARKTRVVVDEEDEAPVRRKPVAVEVDDDLPENFGQALAEEPADGEESAPPAASALRSRLAGLRRS
jgi:hypothetical protein